MNGMLSPYFAGSPTAGGYFIGIFIIAFWLPSHYAFKWLRKNYRSENTKFLSILMCILLSVALTICGVWIERWLRTNTTATPEDIDMLWFLFAMCSSLGVWAGFLSGYIRMKTGL